MLALGGVFFRDDDKAAAADDNDRGWVGVLGNGDVAGAAAAVAALDTGTGGGGTGTGFRVVPDGTGRNGAAGVVTVLAAHFRGVSTVTGLGLASWRMEVCVGVI